uniref:Pyr_redox_2 domain-containing protein n=1 Tax=Rodentolepis nana TaxID=102285 RepID=A0A0R3T4V5_RODNA
LSLSAPASPPLQAISASNPQFIYTVKPTLMGRDVDEALDNIEFSTAVDEATLKPRSLPNFTSYTPSIPQSFGQMVEKSSPNVNGNRLPASTRVGTSRKPADVQQVPINTQSQTKRHQPLRVDVNQLPITKAPPLHNIKSSTPNLQGPPFTDGPHRRGPQENSQTPSVTAERKTGSLDRDGIWRPNRNPKGPATIHPGSTSPIAHGLGYPPSTYPTDLISGSILGPTGFPRLDRRRTINTPRLFPFGSPFEGYLPGGSGIGGVEVPIVVLPPPAVNSNIPYAAPLTPSAYNSTSFRHYPTSPNNNGIRRGTHTVKKNYHVCLVGSGPSAFYVAQSLLKANENIQVDMLEKLPAPFGLVRYGVAPDHPEVKNVISTFTKVAKNPRFNFFGNLVVGKDVKLMELRSVYDAVVLAYGASVDKYMNIPGENLPGVLSVKDFVGWYNGYPKSNSVPPDLNNEHVAIVGMGNVALDAARIMLSSVDRLNVNSFFCLYITFSF